MTTISRSVVIDKPLCRVYQYTDDVFEYELHEATPAAIDEWIDCVMEVLDDLTQEATYPNIIIYSPQGVLPLGYLMTRLRRWLQERPDHKASLDSKLALIGSG